MPKESLQILYNESSKLFNNLGTFDQFQKTLQDPSKRRVLYNAVSKKFNNLGSFEQFEAKVTTKAPRLTAKEILDIPSRFSLRASPERPQPGVYANEYSKPIPNYDGNEQLLAKSLQGRAMLKQYGWEVVEPEEDKMSASDIAKAQNRLFFLSEISKEKKKGISEYKAYKKIRSDLSLPSEIQDLGFEQSITGAVFRTMLAAEQSTDVSLYKDILARDAENAKLFSASQMEQIVSGAISIMMPVDHLLFKYGAAIGSSFSNLKTVAKFADKAANMISKRLKIPIEQARVFAKSAVQRMTGGSGGFAAFDAGKDLSTQIEYTGKVNPMQTVEAIAKGVVTGGTVGFLGAVGSAKGGKVGEYLTEALGLGSVPPLLEGKLPTRADYIEASGMILGLKFLKSFTEPQAARMQDIVANEIEVIVDRTGMKFHEAANEVGNRLKTAQELAMEGKSPEKVRREVRRTKEGIKRYSEEIILEPSKGVESKLSNVKSTIEQLEKQGLKSTADFLKQEKLQESLEALKQEARKEGTGLTPEQIGILQVESPNLITKIESLKKQGLSQKEAESRASISLIEEVLRPAKVINKPLENERVQLNEEVKRLAEEMEALEKGNANQEILDSLQEKIDFNVKRLNEIGVQDIIDVSVARPKELVQSREALESELKVRRQRFNDKIKDIEAELDVKDKAEIKRYNKWLEGKDILNKERGYDPYEYVPLSPPEIGKEMVKVIDSELAKEKLDYKKLRSAVEEAELRDYLEGKDILNREFQPNPMLEVPLHPADVGRRAVELIERQVKPVSELEGQKRNLGLEYQKEYNNLEKTYQENLKLLESSNISELQRSRLEKSNQKANELKRDIQGKAESNGIEMQIFLGFLNPKSLKKFFGSTKHKVSKYSDTEIDRLYDNAMVRLRKDDPKPVRRMVSESTKKPKGMLQNKLPFISGDMVERLQMVGTRATMEGANMGREAINLDKKTYGEISQELNAALDISGSLFGSKGTANRNLSRFEEVEVNGNKIFQSNLLRSIEGNRGTKGAETEIVEKHKDLIEKRGRIFEANEIMQEGPNGEIRPFRVMGRDIAPRIMSTEFYRILENGGVEYNKLVDAFSKAEGQSELNVRKYFNELQQSIVGGSPQTATRTTQAEHSRKWKNIPHAIKVGGELIPLVEYRPFEYARRLGETGSSRVAVAQVFGQENAGTSVIPEMKKRILEEGSPRDVEKFHEMIRALSSAPVETEILDSGSSSGKLLRTAQAGYNLAKTTSLSVSLINNISEPLGNIGRFTGMTGLMRSLFKYSKNPLVLRETLQRLGAITNDPMNIALDPNRSITSAIRAINQLQSRAFLYKHINEFQETLAGIGALDKVERFKKGKGRLVDESYLIEMGFSKENAKLMVQGNAPQEMYNALVRKSPAHLTSGAQRRGEQSRIEHNRWFRRVTEFETYAQMKLRSFARQLKVNEQLLIEAAQEKDFKKLHTVAESFTRDIVGTTAAGIGAQMLLAFAYGGKDNLKIKWNEFDENRLGFAVNSFLYTMFAGSLGQIIQSTANKNIDELSDFVQVFFPYAVAEELYFVGTGKGRYRYLETQDKIIKFGERFAPINKPLGHMMAAWGLGNLEEKKTDNAIKAYYRWKNTKGYGGRYIGNPDDDIVEFRKNMIKAFNSLRSGEDTYIEHMYNAIDGTGKDSNSIKRSLRNRKLLTVSKIAPGKKQDDPEFEKRKLELKKRIGEEGFNRLENYDANIDNWINAIP